ncbi:MAG: hypothetical protein ACTSPW_13010, partial [Promethearchaeota archaeon]
TGIAKPIFFFEIRKDRFLPFHLNKARLFEQQPLVNEIIALDADRLTQNKKKKTIFDEVILFDMGTYITHIIDECGVKLKKFNLNGHLFDINFELIGPKLRTDFSQLSKDAKKKGREIPPLLPYMMNQEVIKQINDFKEKYNIDPFSNEWIITTIKISPKENF